MQCLVMIWHCPVVTLEAFMLSYPATLTPFNREMVAGTKTHFILKRSQTLLKMYIILLNRGINERGLLLRWTFWGFEEQFSFWNICDSQTVFRMIFPSVLTVICHSDYLEEFTWNNSIKCLPDQIVILFSFAKLLLKKKLILFSILVWEKGKYLSLKTTLAND